VLSHNLNYSFTSDSELFCTSSTQLMTYWVSNVVYMGSSNHDKSTALAWAKFGGKLSLLIILYCCNTSVSCLHRSPAWVRGHWIQ